MLKLEFDMPRHRKIPKQDTVLKRVTDFCVQVCGTARFVGSASSFAQNRTLET
jgi:hypothetical protein